MSRFGAALNAFSNVIYIYPNNLVDCTARGLLHLRANRLNRAYRNLRHPADRGHSTAQQALRERDITW